MKVALIHYRLVNRGGLETRLINYSNYFVERGDEVTIICAKKSDDVDIPKEVKVVKIKLGIVPNPFRKLNFAVQVSKYMESHSFDFSLSLSRTYSQDAVLAPGNHLGYLISNNKSFKSVDDRIQIYLDRQSFKESPIIYAASQFMKDELIELYGIEAQKIKVLFPPINTSHFYPVQAEVKTQLQKKYQIDPNAKSFVFASSGHKRKGIQLLLEVFAELDPKQFKLYVAGYPKVKSALSNVYNLGFCKKMMEVYNAVDFTIHPASYEPFGQIIAESILCHTPVIISDKVGAKEVITENTGLLVQSFELQEWIKQLKSINKNAFFKPGAPLIADLSIDSHMEKMLRYVKGNLN